MSKLPKRCRYCGKPIGIIEERMYRSIVVDADPIEVHADPEGEIYIRLDGSKVRAVPADLYSDPSVTAELVWRRHICGSEIDKKENVKYGKCPQMRPV